jgi:hypothetical protein
VNSTIAPVFPFCKYVIIMLPHTPEMIPAVDLRASIEAGPKQRNFFFDGTDNS